MASKLPAQMRFVNATRANMRRSSQIPLIITGAAAGLALAIVGFMTGLIH